MPKPESDEEKRFRELKELEGKNIAHYSVLLDAWIQTRMERDKTLVTLSAAGVGLLVTILTTVGLFKWWEILPYIGAFTGFLLTIWCSLQIYQQNSEHIEEQLKGSSESDPKLEKYDKWSLRLFLTGAIFAIAIGIVSGLNSLYTKGNKKMSNKENNVRCVNSFHGIGKLNPTGTEEKSLSGIQRLRPEAPQSQNQSENQKPQNTASNPSSSNSQPSQSNQPSK